MKKKTSKQNHRFSPKGITTESLSYLFAVILLLIYLGCSIKFKYRVELSTGMAILVSGLITVRACAVLLQLFLGKPAHQQIDFINHGIFLGVITLIWIASSEFVEAIQSTFSP